MRALSIGLGVLAGAIGLLVLAAFVFTLTNVKNFRVEGSAMYPTLASGAEVTVYRAAYARQAPSRGEVIAFHPPPPNDPRTTFLKRIVAVPGDTVEIRDGHVWLNSNQLDEPSIQQPTLPINRSFTQMTLAPNQLYVLGDNRRNSSDSRAWGPVSMQTVVGRAWLVYWPPSSWGFVSNQP